MTDKQPVFGLAMTGDGGVRASRDLITDFYTHGHLYYEIILYPPFDGHITVNGKVFAAGREMALLVTPEDFHSTAAAKGTDAVCIKLCCNSDILSSVGLKPTVLYADRSEVIAPLFRSAADHSNDTEYLKQCIKMAASEINAFGIKVPGLSSGGADQTVKKAMEIINREFPFKISLESTAKRLGVTPQYLSKLFSDTVGISFTKYLCSKRLSYSAALLSNGEHNVTEVCFRCGYQNLSHFVRSFKAKYGTTPGEYGKKSTS